MHLQASTLFAVLALRDLCGASGVPFLSCLRPQVPDPGYSLKGQTPRAIM